MGKLRVLCLHGYQQNKDVFRQKTGSFRKPLKKFVDFEFLDAPHLLQEKYTEEGTIDPAYLQKLSAAPNAAEGRGWWLKNPPEGGEDGLDESLALLESTLEENGPFDALMGFSQGAAFLGLACILLREKLSNIKFVILVAGFKSAMPSHERFYEMGTTISIPSLHVIGQTDEIISSTRSKDLLQLFANGQEVPHPGGHYVPMSKDLRETYKQFVEQFISIS